MKKISLEKLLENPIISGIKTSIIALTPGSFTYNEWKFYKERLELKGCKDYLGAIILDTSKIGLLYYFCSL